MGDTIGYKTGPTWNDHKLLRAQIERVENETLELKQAIERVEVLKAKVRDHDEHAEDLYTFSQKVGELVDANLRLRKELGATDAQIDGMVVT